MKTVIGKNLLKKINQLFDFSRFSKIVILTDENIQMSLINQISQIKRSLNKGVILITIPAGEKEKNIETVKKIWEKMIKSGLDRQSLLINLGGGVVCDIGGFVAATFMRGIDFINVPTTLLSQVDASIGGKNGIDFAGIKNSIGAFKDPIGVIIDVDILKTLPKRELIAAFGEIIKHGVISGREYFDFVSSKKPNEFIEQDLIRIIKKSIQIKSGFTKQDQKEKNLRKVLNFGHTIGHAVESLSWETDNALLHGEAVAVGMAAEAKLANLLGMLPKNELEAINKSLLHAGLPVNIKNIKGRDIVKIILFDKKNTNGIINWSLPKKIGEVLINVKVPENLVVKAVESIIS